MHASSTVNPKAPLTMNIEQCTESLRGKVGDNSGLNATLKFDCGADGVEHRCERTGLNRPRFEGDH